MKKVKQLKRFNPKAWIEFLVEYNATNVYHIWNPMTGHIISTQDVKFNEKEMYNGNKDDLRTMVQDKLKNLSLEEISTLLNHIDQGTNSNTNPEEEAGGNQGQDDKIFEAPNRQSSVLEE